MWTWKHIRKRAIEATKTSIRMPRVKGPQQYGNAMPEIVRSISKGDRKDAPTRSNIPATSKDIEEMDEFFQWVNDYLPTKKDRVEVFHYCDIKTRKDRTFDEYLQKNDIMRRKYDYQIQKIFQKVADKLNSVNKTKHLAPDLQIVKTPVHEETSKVRELYNKKRLPDGTVNTWIRPESAVPKI